jgi:hypothetical protein
MYDLKPHLMPKVRSKKIMATAAGVPCTARIASFIPGLRCESAATTVACHLPVGGKGTSTKETDLAVAYSCSVCHDLLDGRNAAGHAYLIEHHAAAVMQQLLRAHVMTLTVMLEEGVIVIPDADVLPGDWR